MARLSRPDRSGPLAGVRRRPDRDRDSTRDSQVTPAADLRNGQVFIQDNLWSTAERQFAVWVAPDGTPVRGGRRRGSDDWTTATSPTRPQPARGADRRRSHNVYAIGTDRDRGVHVAGNMDANRLRYVRSRSSGCGGGAPARRRRRRQHQLSGVHGAAGWDLAVLAAAGRRTRGSALDADALQPGSAMGAPRDDPRRRPAGESPYLHHIAVDPHTGLDPPDVRVALRPGRRDHE